MNRKLTTCFIATLMFFGVSMKAENKKLRPVDYVNPFIGTTNFGTTNPGAVMPNGLMSVVHSLRIS